jgi:hypothetical protein
MYNDMSNRGNKKGILDRLINGEGRHDLKKQRSLTNLLFAGALTITTGLAALLGAQQGALAAIEPIDPTISSSEPQVTQVSLGTNAERAEKIDTQRILQEGRDALRAKLEAQSQIPAPVVEAPIQTVTPTEQPAVQPIIQPTTPAQNTNEYPLGSAAMPQAPSLVTPVASQRENPPVSPQIVPQITLPTTSSSPLPKVTETPQPRKVQLRPSDVKAAPAILAAPVQTSAPKAIPQTLRVNTAPLAQPKPEINTPPINPINVLPTQTREVTGDGAPMDVIIPHTDISNLNLEQTKRYQQDLLTEISNANELPDELRVKVKSDLYLQLDATRARISTLEAQASKPIPLTPIQTTPPQAKSDPIPTWTPPAQPPVAAAPVEIQSETTDNLRQLIEDLGHISPTTTQQALAELESRRIEQLTTLQTAGLEIPALLTKSVYTRSPIPTFPGNTAQSTNRAIPATVTQSIPQTQRDSAQKLDDHSRALQLQAQAKKDAELSQQASVPTHSPYSTHTVEALKADLKDLYQRLQMAEGITNVTAKQRSIANTNRAIAEAEAVLRDKLTSTPTKPVGTIDDFKNKGGASDLGGVINGVPESRTQIDERAQALLRINDAGLQSSRIEVTVALEKLNSKLEAKMNSLKLKYIDASLIPQNEVMEVQSIVSQIMSVNSIPKTKRSKIGKGWYISPSVNIGSGLGGGLLVGNEDGFQVSVNHVKRSGDATTKVGIGWTF